MESCQVSQLQQRIQGEEAVWGEPIPVHAIIWRKIEASEWVYGVEQRLVPEVPGRVTGS